MASTSTLNSQSRETWMTIPVPPIGGEVEYPKGSISYQRQNIELPGPPFFFSHWYVGLICIVLFTLVVYSLLAVSILYRFEWMKQRKAKPVVANAYQRDGFFNLESYTVEESTNAPAHRSRRPPPARSTGRASGQFLEREEAGNAESRSPALSENEDAAVGRNPLRR